MHTNSLSLYLKIPTLSAVLSSYQIYYKVVAQSVLMTGASPNRAEKKGKEPKV